MLDLTKRFKIYDDRGDGDDFFLQDIKHHDDDIVLCTVTNEWYSEPFYVLIYLDDNMVVGKDFEFYYAKNIDE